MALVVVITKRNIITFGLIFSDIADFVLEPPAWLLSLWHHQSGQIWKTKSWAFKLNFLASPPAPSPAKMHHFFDQVFKQCSPWSQNRKPGTDGWSFVKDQQTFGTVLVEELFRDAYLGWRMYFLTSSLSQHFKKVHMTPLEELHLREERNSWISGPTCCIHSSKFQGFLL